jgi:hypothetical protein
LIYHFGYVQQTTAIHVGGMNLVPTSHVEDKQPASNTHVGGIGSVEKPRWIGRNAMFPCNICKGYHFNHMCPGITEARILWSMSRSSSDSEYFSISLQSIHPFFDEVVVPMKSSVDPTPLLGGDVPSDHVVSHSI